MELDEYLRYLEGHSSENPRVFPVYGNDVEIFDFRPGRYHTEPALREAGEWGRIEQLFRAILKDERFQFILPSAALDWMSAPGAGNRLHLESAEDPVPVKKQEKYNITRWAVTGRNDLGINTECHRFYNALKQRNEPHPDDEAWRELCYLWSSDFRTHITDKRWSGYLEHLRQFERHLDAGKVVVSSAASRRVSKAQLPCAFRTRREGRFLRLENDLVEVALNCRRGLAIDSLVVKNISGKSLLGTLPHGFYQDIALGADYYSGHLVLETPGQPKITDLSAVAPIVTGADDGSVIVEGEITTPLGQIRKRIRLSAEGQLGIEYKLEWEEMPPGALRLAHVTLNPDAFDSRRLYFESHNGGFLPERFSVEAKRIEHGRSVSFLVSASGAMGMTNGELSLGDDERVIRVRTDMGLASVVAQITFIPVAGSFFYRASFSAAELDETCRNRPRVDFPRTFAFTVAAGQFQAISQPEAQASEAVAPK